MGDGVEGWDIPRGSVQDEGPPKGMADALAAALAWYASTETQDLVVGLRHGHVLAAEVRMAQHSDALIEARSRRGITDCSTPLYIRVQNIVDELEKAEAALAALKEENKALKIALDNAEWAAKEPTP